MKNKLLMLSILIAISVSLIIVSPFNAATTQADNDDGKERWPTLWTLAENVILEPGQGWSSEWLDVKCFRSFKIYAKQTPNVGGILAPCYMEINDGPLGSEGQVTYWSPERYPEDTWESRGVGGPKARWVLTDEFGGLFSNIRVFAKNNSGSQATVTVYLLVARE